MKKLLVPIDFSKASDNALLYAVEFARASRMQISMLHVYDSLIYESGDVLVSTEELIATYLKQLKSIRTKIHRQYGETLPINYYCEPGTVVAKINDFATEHHADLIIMGMQGGGYISEKIIGSTATSLMRQSVCPVMGIARHVRYQRIERILLATDYRDAPYYTLLKPLKALVRQFHTELFLVHVQRSETDVIEKGVQATIEENLEGIYHTVHTVRNDDVLKGIEQFVIDHDVHIAAVIPREHAFFHALFHEANTKKLAFHLHVPLLALHNG